MRSPICFSYFSVSYRKNWLPLVAKDQKREHILQREYLYIQTVCLWSLFFARGVWCRIYMYLYIYIYIYYSVICCHCLLQAFLNTTLVLKLLLLGNQTLKLYRVRAAVIFSGAIHTFGQRTRHNPMIITMIVIVRITIMMMIRIIMTEQ